MTSLNHSHLRVVAETTLSLGHVTGRVRVLKVFERKRKVHAICQCESPCTTDIRCTGCGQTYVALKDVPLRGAFIGEELVTFDRAKRDALKLELAHDTLRVETIITLEEANRKYATSNLYYLLPMEGDHDFSKTYSALVSVMHSNGWAGLARFAVDGVNHRWVVFSDGGVFVAHDLMDRQPAPFAPALSEPDDVEEMTARLSPLVRMDADFPPCSDPASLLLEREGSFVSECRHSVTTNTEED